MRLTEKRERLHRDNDAEYTEAELSFPFALPYVRRELLGEIDALRAQLSAAERRISELETDLCQAYERIKKSSY